MSRDFIPRTALRSFPKSHENVGPTRSSFYNYLALRTVLRARNFAIIGVRAGGARGAAAPPKFGQLRFLGQQEKIWAKPVVKDVSMFFIIIIIILKR